ncbi:hepatocyte nuclear factor 6-like [Frankliniella occidentalis]|uniref:Hepatocyte nuclear factor 6-like n=1 Tax=Frankliniella occidentalis TaxID=133901 RepID=A0A9C6X5J3_FRAOC|nr:hepatocyte nuclear factor 6-like [Frankliniella occidentalis]XP_052129631.1 hepatocyte nuclear factor 6-like [Frankliniella occidentalis]
MMVDTGEYPFGSPSPAPPPAPTPAFPAGPHSYATLTPLQPLPPLNAIPEEFGFVSTDGYGGGPNGNVSGSFTVMQANGAPLHAPYPYRGPPHPAPPPPPPPPHAGGGYYDMGCEQQHSQCYDYRDAYCPVQQDYYPVTVKTELHPHHYLREAGTPPSPSLHQQHPPSQHTPPAQPPPPPQQQQQQSPPPPLPVAVKSEQQQQQQQQQPPLQCHQPSHQVVPPQQQQQQQQQEAEEINTKELAQRISAELKRYSIPQAIFAQRILCRSQGTLSDLLRNPKPWSKLKSGRETFRRMWKWLQEPEYQRMSSLRHAAAQIPQRAACKRKLDLHHHALPMQHDRLDRLADRKQRLLFADLQRYF